MKLVGRSLHTWISQLLLTGVGLSAVMAGMFTIQGHFIKPDAILVLGGHPEREEFTTHFARQYPHLPIWISSGANSEFINIIFSEAEVDLARIHLDYQAVDTVTNFTTLVDQLKARNIDSVFVITSDNHMRRAQVIGTIVFASRGIHFKAVPVPTGRSPEPVEKILRDGARAILWVFTGRTGSSLGRMLSHPKNVSL